MGIGFIKDEASYLCACLYLAAMGFCGLISVVQVFRWLRQHPQVALLEGQHQEQEDAPGDGHGGLELDAVVTTFSRTPTPPLQPQPRPDENPAKRTGAMEITEEYYRN